MGVEKIAGLRPTSPFTRINFSFAPDGNGPDGTNKKKTRAKKLSPEAQKKVAEARAEAEKRKILADYEAEHQKIKQQLEQQKAKEAARDEAIKNTCGDAIKAYREASKTYKTYLIALRDKAKLKTSIEDISPLNLDLMLPEEAKTRAAYQNAEFAAWQALRTKLIAALGAEAKPQSGREFIFSYINDLTYKPPESASNPNTAEAVKP